MVVMQQVAAMVSRSPPLMAELRRIPAFLRRKGIVLQIYQLPSALKLYADRLSRRRRLQDYLALPRIGGASSRFAWPAAWTGSLPGRWMYRVFEGVL